MMTPVVATLAIGLTGDSGVTTGAAGGSDGTGVDTLLAGAAEGVEVALAIDTDAAANRVREIVGTDPGIATATADRVGRVTTMTLPGSMTSTVERARRAIVGVASRRFTTCIRNVPPQPANSKPTSNMSKIPCTLRSIGPP